MKTKIKILATYVLSFLLVLQSPLMVLAESGENQTGTYANGTDGAALSEQTYTVEDDGLKFTVSYPTDIKCGTPTTFKFDAEYSGDPTLAHGELSYRIDSLIVNDGSELVSVYDVSRGSNSAYKKDKTFDFTFYASGTYYISFNALYRTPNGNGTYKVTTADTGYYTRGIKLTINDPQFPPLDKIVENVTAECLANCSTDYEKALWLNDWIVSNCSYDNSLTYCSAEGALARGTGTCEAYHRAYVMLLNKVGIPTGRITGNGHVWTAVKMDGKWYQVDPTWNDAGYNEPNIKLNYLYFGLNDEIMTKVHPDHKPVPGYESVSLDQNYFIKSGGISKWADPVIEIVRKHIDKKETNFSIEINQKAPGASDYASAYATVLYNLVAHVLANTSWSNEALNVNLNASYIPKDNSSGTIACTAQYTTIPLSFQRINLENANVKIGANAKLSYAINRKALVTIQVFDANNRCLHTLVSDKAIGTATQTVQWNLKNSSGSYVPNGSYRFTITVKDTFGNSSVEHKYFNVTGNTSSGSGSGSGNTGSGNTGSGSGSSSGNTGSGNTGSGSGSNSGNTGSSSGNTGSGSGSNSGNTGSGNTGSGSGSNSGNTGSGNTGSGSGSNSGNTGSGNTGSGSGSNSGNTGSGNTGSGSGSNSGNTGSGSGSNTGTGTNKGVWMVNGLGWWFQRPNGSYPKNTWEKIDGCWYWFNNSGYMTVGWQYINGSWYYLTGSGTMATGWQYINGSWYYMADGGAMATGWQYINGSWYYMTDGGVMATGWQHINGSWYYMADGGVMATGWQHINGSWYYMADDGTMTTGWQYINGSWYYMADDGTMTTGWQYINGSWYYLTDSGTMASNTWIGNSYLNGNGVWAA